MGIEGCEKNGAIVQCLLKYWMKALDECGRDATCRRLESVFAAGNGAIDVKDEAFGNVITASNFEEYDQQWQAVTEHVDSMAFELIGESAIDVNSERAIIRFELSGTGLSVDGSPLAPQQWRCEHEWRQFEGEWRIVRERMKSV